MKFRFAILKEELSNEYDSEGNQLTKEQAEFFKNSKVRDEQGRLLVCRHSTESEFDEFQYKYLSEGKLGYGFYFIRDEQQRERERQLYKTNYSPKYRKACYLNVTNPAYDEDVSDIIQAQWDFEEQNESASQKEIIDFTNHKFNCDGIISYDRNSVVCFYPNQIKSITNKNPTNSNNINEELNVEPWKQCIDLLLNKLREYREDEIVKLIYANKTDIVPTTSPFYITKDGKYIDVNKVCANNHFDGEGIHSDLLCIILEKIYYDKIQERDVSYEDWFSQTSTDEFDVDDLTYAYLDETSTILGWVRGNPGTEWIENRLYFVIPYNATDAQLRAVRDCLEELEDTKHEYQAYFLNANGETTWHVKYSFWKTPDMFLRIMRNYVNNGKKPIDEKLKINEDLIFEDKYVDVIANYDEINKYLHYNYEWADTPDEENYSQLIDKEGRFIHCPPSKSSFTHKLLLDDLIESGLVSMGDAYNYLNTSLFGNLGYVRCNDYDAYVQLPQNITYDQIDAISNWIDEYFLGRGYTVIDTSCEENKTYSRYMFEYDDRHQADDYIKMLKRFKNSGKLIESLKHINEDLMHKDGMYVFNSPYALMDFLRNQINDVRILYDSNLDLYFACDGDKYIHYDLIKQAEKEGYYYKLNDFIDELGAFENYIDYGVNGGYVGEDGEDFEYIDPYLYYIIFSPNNEFELGDDDYDKEYNTSIGRFLTRDCDLEEIDLYKVVKRCM